MGSPKHQGLGPLDSKIWQIRKGTRHQNSMGVGLENSRAHSMRRLTKKLASVIVGVNLIWDPLVILSEHLRAVLVTGKIEVTLSVHEPTHVMH